MEKVREQKKRAEERGKQAVSANRVKTEALEDFYGKAKARKFEFFSDEPEKGGKNRAPRPLEYFLAGFAFCQQVQYSKYAALRGIELSDLEIDVRGYVDARGIFEIGNVKPGFKNIEYDLNIKSPENEDTIRNLIEKVENICPAHAALRNSGEINRDATLNGSTLKI